VSEPALTPHVRQKSTIASPDLLYASTARRRSSGLYIRVRRFFFEGGFAWGPSRSWRHVPSRAARFQRSRHERVTSCAAQNASRVPSHLPNAATISRRCSGV